MLPILCVRLTIKVKVGIPESFKVGWYLPKKLGRVTLSHYDDDYNDDFKKTIGFTLMIKTTALHVQHVF